MSDETTNIETRRERIIVQITPRVLNPMGAARYIGVGRSKFFELLKNGEIPAKKSGSKTLIEVAALNAWIDALPNARA